MSEHHTSRETAHAYEPLTDERLGDLLAAVGNHEGKALLLLAMNQASQEDRYFTKSELHRLLKSLPGAGQEEIGNLSNQFDWCQLTLAPIGLVAKADYISPVSYAITEEGRRLGKPLAGFMLDFADRHGVSLITLLGSTHSKGKMRAPVARIKLIQEVLDNPDTHTIKSLAEVLDDPKLTYTRNHLKELAADGFITFSSWDITNPTSYALENPPAPSNLRPDTWIAMVTTYLKKHGSATPEELAAYARKSGAPRSKGLDDKVLLHKITNNIETMVQRGILRYAESRQYGQQGVVSLTPENAAIWQELIEGLGLFKTNRHENLEHFSLIADEFLGDPYRVPRAIRSARANSPYTHKETGQPAGMLILSALGSAATALTINEIAQTVAEQTGRRMPYPTIRREVKKLVRQEAVAEDIGKASVYRVNPAT